MSDEERNEGARLIEEKIRDAFSSAGKTVSDIQWNLDRGGQLLNYSSHTIHVTVNGEELNKWGQNTDSTNILNKIILRFTFLNSMAT